MKKNDQSDTSAVKIQEESEFNEIGLPRIRRPATSEMIEENTVKEHPGVPVLTRAMFDEKMAKRDHGACSLARVEPDTRVDHEHPPRAPRYEDTYPYLTPREIQLVNQKAFPPSRTEVVIQKDLSNEDFYVPVRVKGQIVKGTSTWIQPLIYDGEFKKGEHPQPEAHMECVRKNPGDLLLNKNGDPVLIPYEAPHTSYYLNTDIFKGYQEKAAGNWMAETAKRMYEEYSPYHGTNPIKCLPEDNPDRGSGTSTKYPEDNLEYQGEFKTAEPGYFGGIDKNGYNWDHVLGQKPFTMSFRVVGEDEADPPASSGAWVRITSKSPIQLQDIKPKSLAELYSNPKPQVAMHSPQTYQKLKSLYEQNPPAPEYSGIREVNLMYQAGKDLAAKLGRPVVYGDSPLQELSRFHKAMDLFCASMGIPKKYLFPGQAEVAQAREEARQIYGTFHPIDKALPAPSVHTATQEGEIALKIMSVAEQKRTMEAQELNRWLNSHTHASERGPSGPPVQPSPLMAITEHLDSGYRTPQAQARVIECYYCGRQALEFRKSPSACQGCVETAQQEREKNDR